VPEDVVDAVELGRLAAEVADYWDECLSRNATLTPFHSRVWLTEWAKAYDATADAFVLVHRDGSGRLGGLLPMMRWSGEVRSLSYNATDYTGMVWFGNARPAAIALARQLRTIAADEPVRLWNIRPGDPLLNVLATRSGASLLGRSATSAIRIADARLRPWRQLERTSQRDLERRRDRLKAAGMRIWYGTRITDDVLVELTRVHTARWEARGEPGNFGDPRRVEFVRRLIRSRLRLFFGVMSVDESVLGYRFGPIDDTTYYDWNTGTDPAPAFRRLSPGLVLLDDLVGRLFLSERVRRIDFLRGDEDYKRAWQTDDSWVSEYEVLPQVDTQEARN
jgi:CelD/BcsL family acetyltransferase involved in cellulose biosynthesis